VNDRDEESRPIDRWAEAVGWYSTLRAADEKDLTSTVGRAWQDWYADAQNRRVFDDVSRLLAGRDLYRRRSRPRKAELAQDRYDLSIPIAQWLGANPKHETKKRRSPARGWWWLFGGFATAILLMVVTLSPLRFRSNGVQGDSIIYKTEVGGLKEVHLQDGSRITLGGRTKLLVAFSGQRRSINLIDGQAWFRVVHDTARPFIVTAGDGTIKDVGTAFLVTRDSDRVIVTVTEGVVEVSARQRLLISPATDQELTPRPVRAPIRISRSEQLAFGDNGAFGSIMPTDTRDATTWTRGRLTFDDQPLRYVIETVDRYSSRRIVVDPAAGALRFSGIVFADDISEWVQSLAAIFPVTVVQGGAVVWIEMRPPSVVSR
jgi:transmembrane sensor